MRWIPLLIAGLTVTKIRAANDWNKPCFNGTCSYIVGDGASKAFGTLLLRGDQNTISDITEVSGWAIWGCKSNIDAQDIRLACVGEQDDCDHLRKGGDINTIVRLPQSCGRGPFARVSASWRPMGEKLPSHVQAMALERKKALPEIMALRIDTNFSAIPSDQGVVEFGVSATNIPGQEQNVGVKALSNSLDHKAKLKRRELRFKRTLLEERGPIDDFFALIERLNAVNSTHQGNTKLDIRKDKISVFQHSGTCSGVSGDVEVSLDAELQATVAYGYVVLGTLVPPSVSDFGLYSGLQSSLSTTFNIQASAMGTIDSGRIKLYEAGLPGLDFPGIFTLGPTYELSAQAQASFVAQTQAVISANYIIPAVHLAYPFKYQKSKALAKPFDSPIKLDVSSSSTITSTIEVKLVPRLNNGITLLGGAAYINVFVEADMGPKLSGTLASDGHLDHGGNLALNNEACLDLTSSINIKAGMEGGLATILTPHADKKLFSREQSLWKKCFKFGSTNPTTSAAPVPAPSAGTHHAIRSSSELRRTDGVQFVKPDTKHSTTASSDLSCPALSSITNLIGIVNEIIEVP